ncbi:MAG: MerR family transcriptional regulator [Moorea sp. SIO3I7]|nr:MerR family transcriptional regulator [Moorena sp. SIO3I7]
MRFLTAKKACQELGITKVTLEYWEQQGMIQTISDRNNTKRYDIDSLASESNQDKLARVPAALDPQQPQWVSLKEAMKRLGVARGTLRSWEAAGKIKTKRNHRNHRLYDLSSVRSD